MKKEASSYGAASSKTKEVIEVHIANSLPGLFNFLRNAKLKIHQTIIYKLGQNVYERAQKTHHVLRWETHIPTKVYPPVEYLSKIDENLFSKSEYVSSDL